MAEDLRQDFQSWGLDQFLQRYPGLSIVPATGDGLLIEGVLPFRARSGNREEIEDAYRLEIYLRSSFPREIPVVRETEYRIPKDFHRLQDGSLCLGSPLRLHTLLVRNPTLTGFVDHCLIPFLYSRSYFKKHGTLPIGELDHGNKGILEDYQDLFHVGTKEASLQMLFLLTLPKRVANKKPCPCEIGRRVGTCHHRVLNELRRIQNRAWFQKEHENRCLPDPPTDRPKQGPFATESRRQEPLTGVLGVAILLPFLQP